MKTHLIIIRESIQDKKVFDKLKIIGKKKAISQPWTLYKIDISENLEIAKKLQKELIENYYFHYYNEKNVFVFFKNKFFKLNKTKKDWNEFINYGILLGILKEQLNLDPINFEDEKY